MTTHYDRYGLMLSTESGVAAERYREGLDRLLSYDGSAEPRLLEAVAADPQFALAHAALAILRWQRGERPAAREHARTASALADAATPREREHIRAVVATVEGHRYLDAAGYQAPNPEALRLARAQLERAPRDALMLLIASILTVFSGDPGEKRSLLALYERLAAEYGADDWWFAGWHGMCAAEMREVDSARFLIDRALDLNPRNPIAAHGYAHLAYEVEGYRDGAEFLDTWLDDYERDAVYYSHVTWHYALCSLLAGEPDRALHAHRRAIDPGAVRPVRTTLADSVSLLWRCLLYFPELAPQLPWAPTSAYAATLTREPGVPFRDVLAAMAFLGAGNDARTRRLRGDLRALDPERHPLARQLVVPLVEGLEAFAHEDYEGAIQRIEPVLDGLYRLGGSYQQRDVFEETLVIAKLRAGHGPAEGAGAATRAESRAAFARVAQVRIARGQGA